MRCLAKDPVQRPQTADEVLHELDSMTMPLGITPTTGGIEAPSSQRRWRTALAVAVPVLAVAAVLYAVTRQDESKNPPVASPVQASAPIPAPPPLPTQSPAANAATSTPAPPRPIITHEDSVRIAEAVRKRTEAARLKDSVAKARLAEEIQRKMTDSIIAANSGGVAALAAPRRVVVIEPAEQKNWPEATLVGRAVSDSLRRMLRARRQQFAVVDPDSVRAAVARTQSVPEITKSLNADLLVIVRLQALPRDSALLMLQSYDNGAVRQFQARTAGGRPVPKSEVLSNLDQVLLSTIGYLDEMLRAPRRPVPASP